MGVLALTQGSLLWSFWPTQCHVHDHSSRRLTATQLRQKKIMYPLALLLNRQEQDTMVPSTKHLYRLCSHGLAGAQPI